MALNRAICPPCTVDVNAGNEDWRIALRDYDTRIANHKIPMNDRGHPVSPYPVAYVQWLKNHLSAIDYSEGRHVK